jgi:hypothetical protein
VKLDIYRSCSRKEKRDVLNTFWHSNMRSPTRIHQAAYQYGPFAVLCLVALALELALIIFVSIDRALVVGWIAVLLEAVVLLSLWWALIRCRVIRRQTN